MFIQSSCNVLPTCATAQDQAAEHALQLVAAVQAELFFGRLGHDPLAVLTGDLVIVASVHLPLR